MARDYDHLFKLLIIGDSGKHGCGRGLNSVLLCNFFYYRLCFRRGRKELLVVEIRR